MAATLAELLGAIELLRAEVAQLRRELRREQGVSERPVGRGLRFAQEQQLVSLDQMAAIVQRSKRSLEDHRQEMPAPRVRGRRGRPALWAWSEVRPWLEEYAGYVLPETFPSYAG